MLTIVHFFTEVALSCWKNNGHCRVRRTLACVRVLFCFRFRSLGNFGLWQGQFLSVLTQCRLAQGSQFSCISSSMCWNICLFVPLPSYVYLTEFFTDVGNFSGSKFPLKNCAFSPKARATRWWSFLKIQAETVLKITTG